jgi:hypothetical protein
MLKRSLVGLSVLVLGGCLDIFGADSSGDDDSDGGESGESSGPFRGGTGGRGRGGSAGDPAGGAVTGGSSSGGTTAGNPNTGGDAPVGGMGGMGVGGVISFAGKAGASTGGASTGGAGQGGTGAGNGGKAGSTGTGGSAGGTCTTEELLLNQHFDYGDTDWQFESYNWASLVVNQATAGVEPQSGTFLGRLGGYELADDILYQFVDIPSSATNIVLSFYEQVATTWTYDYPYDLLGAGVFDAVTSDSFGEITLSNTDAHTGWVRRQVSIDPSAAGAYVLVAVLVYGYYDLEYSTLFVDTMSLQARVCR